MVALRFAVFLLPQLWVLRAFRTFHETAVAVSTSATTSLQFGLMADAAVIVVIGVGTLAANCLVVAVLLKVVAARQAHRRSRRAEQTAPARHTRGTRRGQSGSSVPPVRRRVDPPRRSNRV